MNNHDALTELAHTAAFETDIHEQEDALANLLPVWDETALDDFVYLVEWTRIRRDLTDNVIRPQDIYGRGWDDRALAIEDANTHINNAITSLLNPTRLPLTERAEESRPVEDVPTGGLL